MRGQCGREGVGSGRRSGPGSDQPLASVGHGRPVPPPVVQPYAGVVVVVLALLEGPLVAGPVGGRPTTVVSLGPHPPDPGPVREETEGGKNLLHPELNP